MDIDLAVIGLGYVGLPLARGAVSAGLKVVGLDRSAARVSAVGRHESPVSDVTDADLAQMHAAGFFASTDSALLAGARAVVICVPTPLADNGVPDLSAIVSASETVAQHLRVGMLVILESTTYPGTTDEVVRPILEASGLKAGTDFYLAFSPERIDPGNPHFGIKNTPKVVGGFTPDCAKAAESLYAQFVDEVVLARGTREAETAKLLENTYRHVNIALINEMARFCHELDIDIWDVIRCAATKPFGFEVFHPGPGVGGHCIPIDPNYLSFKVRSALGYNFRFVELAQEINASMPGYVVQRVQDMLNDAALALRGSKILLLGVSYKKDVPDDRETPARQIASLLADKGAIVQFHDPHVSTFIVDGTDLERVADLDVAIDQSDAVLLLQAHSAYDLTDIARRPKRILDTRGVLAEPAYRL